MRRMINSFRALWWRVRLLLRVRTARRDPLAQLDAAIAEQNRLREMVQPVIIEARTARLHLQRLIETRRDVRTVETLTRRSAEIAELEAQLFRANTTISRQIEQLTLHRKLLTATRPLRESEAQICALVNESADQRRTIQALIQQTGTGSLREAVDTLQVIAEVRGESSAESSIDKKSKESL
jgi:hypothetical protein